MLQTQNGQQQQTPPTKPAYPSLMRSRRFCSVLMCRWLGVVSWPLSPGCPAWGCPGTMPGCGSLRMRQVSSTLPGCLRASVVQNEWHAAGPAVQLVGGSTLGSALC